MDNAKKNKLIEWLTFIYLVLFPFGQLLRIEVNIFSRNIPLHPIDVISGLFFVLFLFGKFKKPDYYFHFKNFLLAGLFSLVLSLALFKTFSGLIGGLYLLRTLSYLCFSVVIWNYLKDKNSLKERLYKSLIFVSLVVAIFGWYQYFIYPDFRPLFYIGWDDHLYRLIGTFLDPGFTAIILVFGYLLSLAKFNQTKDKKILLLMGVFLFSIAFTYTRAAFLAFAVGLTVFSIVQRKIKFGLFQLLFFFLIVLFLPRTAGEGVNLTRISSVYARLTSNQEIITIIKKSPLFGFGFNNLCLAKEKLLGLTNINSHSCSGSDLNILGILAMTGVVGLIFFLKAIIEILKGVGKDIYGLSFLSCGVALIIHSLFVNSLFYSWIMGYIGILLAISWLGREGNR